MFLRYTKGAKLGKWAFAFSLLNFAVYSAPKETCKTTLSNLLSSESTWTHIESLEEQPTAHIGGSPRAMALSLPLPSSPQIPSRIKKVGEKEMNRIREKLKLKEAEFETWVTYDGWGDYTWAIARYRPNPKSDWIWLNESFKNPEATGSPNAPKEIVLPHFLNPSKESHWDQLFNNTPKDLYQRPSFGSAVWMTKDKKSVVHAWLSPSEMETWEQKLKNQDLSVAIIPPPSRLGETPVTFIVKSKEQSIEWPENIVWRNENNSKAIPIKMKQHITHWPHELKKHYLEYIKRYSGGTPIQSPLTGKIIDVGKLGVGEKDNQTLDVIAHLKQHYESLGFNKKNGWEATEQFFHWRGIKQANLIVKIKGSLPESENHPVILSDHIDKAIAEDTYEKTKERITNPGADDNSTATAALLTAADIFKERYKDHPPKHDIWLVHFTGEEFPGSSLGARHFISELLKNKTDVGANINMDMLGHRTSGDTVFQINPGSTESSWKLAQVALHAAQVQAPEWDAKVRKPFAKNSYITQTDATFFDYAGYPTILINEHMNLARRVNPYYHQSVDTFEKVDLDYAISQAKVAIETAARMAELSVFPAAR